MTDNTNIWERNVGQNPHHFAQGVVGLIINVHTFTISLIISWTWNSVIDEEWTYLFSDLFSLIKIGPVFPLKKHNFYKDN